MHHLLVSLQFALYPSYSPSAPHSHYYRTFDAKNILVLRSEDLFTSPERTMDRVTDFLGLGRNDWGPIVDTKYNFGMRNQIEKTPSKQSRYANCKLK